MDDIVEVVAKSIWSVIRFILWDFLFSVALFNIGRVTLLMFTFGKYPRFKHLEKDAVKIAYFGLFIICLAWLSLALYNNINT